MKRKSLSMILVILLVMNPVLPWMKTQTVFAENAQTLIMEDETFYNALKAGITPDSAVQSDDLTQTIGLDMEAVTNIEINMSGVEMTDANKEIIQKIFQECTQLRTLRIRRCDFSGFDDADFSGLNNKSSLTTLCLVSCKLNKAPDIKLPTLRNLSLAWNSLAADDACKSITVDNFPNLTSLFLDDTNVSDVNFLRNMNNLTTLSLGWAKLTDDSLAALLDMSGGLPNLTYLNLGASEHDDISYGTKQQSFLSSSNKITDTKNLALLPSSFPKLKELDLSGLEITSLQDFVGIREDVGIDFQVNALTDFAGLEENKKFTLKRQRFFVPYKFARGWGGEIPELLKRVIDKNDVLCGTQKYDLKYEYCSLSDDGKKIVIPSDAPGTSASSAKVRSGILDGTVFYFSLKKLPEPVVPENLTATEGDTLAAIVLPEGFTWQDSASEVGTAGTHTF